PIARQVHDCSHDQRNQRAALAADQIADAHEQGGQPGQQDRGTQVVHRGNITPSGSALLASPSGYVSSGRDGATPPAPRVWNRAVVSRGGRGRGRARGEGGRRGGPRSLAAARRG